MPVDISATEAYARQRAGAVLVDVREDDERAAGGPQGAIGLARARFESDPATVVAELSSEVLLICASGIRSALTARALAARGYCNLASVQGGVAAWQAAGLPMTPVAGVDNDFRERYARHLVLPHVGVSGQQRLAGARVLLVGAGGLGSPCAFYLAAAGVGHLRIADADVVDRSNLQRQILHTDAGVGEAKVDSARERLHALNPTVDIETVLERANAANVMALLDGVDVVVDGSDNFPTRYLLNDACLRAGVPLVSAAVERFSGQISVFDAGRRRGQLPCYRCLFPEPPSADDAPDCSAAGVLGVLPGLLGVMQAAETVKLLLSIGQPLTGRLLQVDALSMRFSELRVSVDPHCAACGEGRPLPELQDIPQYCASP